MWNDLRRFLRQSVDAFRAELNNRAPEDQVVDLLAGMRKEWTAARAALPAHEADLQRIVAELAQERAELAQCERRGSLAERIGDRETVAVAHSFASRHRERISVLERKRAAAEAELALRRREVDEMKERYHAADANRFLLLAHLRRMAEERSGAASSASMEDWSRIEEQIEREAGFVDAWEEVDEAIDRAASRPPDAEEVERRLEDLKRRMGRQP